MTSEYINPEQMVEDKYYIFTMRDNDYRPIKIFGQFVSPWNGHTYKFSNVLIKTQNSTHRYAGELVVWNGDINRLTPVPNGVVLFIYTLLESTPGMTNYPDIIADIAERVSHEDPFKDPNGFDINHGGRKRKSRKRRR